MQLSCVILVGSVYSFHDTETSMCSAFTPYSIYHPFAMPCICEPMIAQGILRPLRWGTASSDKPAELLHVSIQISRAVREENRISPTCRSIAAFDRPARSQQNPSVSPWSRPRDQLAEFICPRKAHVATSNSLHGSKMQSIFITMTVLFLPRPSLVVKTWLKHLSVLIGRSCFATGTWAGTSCPSFSPRVANGSRAFLHAV